MRFKTVRRIAILGGMSFLVYQLYQNERTRGFLGLGVQKVKDTVQDNIQRMQYRQSDEFQNVDSLRKYQDSVLRQWNMIE